MPSPHRTTTSHENRSEVAVHSARCCSRFGGTAGAAGAAGAATCRSLVWLRAPRTFVCRARCRLYFSPGCLTRISRSLLLGFAHARSAKARRGAPAAGSMPTAGASPITSKHHTHLATSIEYCYVCMPGTSCVQTGPHLKQPPLFCLFWHGQVWNFLWWSFTVRAILRGAEWVWRQSFFLVLLPLLHNYFWFAGVRSPHLYRTLSSFVSADPATAPM